MSTPEVSGELSRAQLLKIFRDNADYDLQDTVAAGLAKARLFIAAGRNLIATPLKRTASGGRNGEEVELDPAITKQQLDQAAAWYKANAVLAGATQQLPRQFVPADDFRD